MFCHTPVSVNFHCIQEYQFSATTIQKNITLYSVQFERSIMPVGATLLSCLGLLLPPVAVLDLRLVLPLNAIVDFSDWCLNMNDSCFFLSRFPLCPRHLV